MLDREGGALFRSSLLTEPGVAGCRGQSLIPRQESHHIFVWLSPFKQMGLSDSSSDGTVRRIFFFFFLFFFFSL